MPTSYTSLLGLALPVTGELSGVWGDTVNDYISKYVDASVAGTQTISGTQTAVTLTRTNGSSLSQVGSGLTGSSQYQIINCTGNPAGTLTITVDVSTGSPTLSNATYSQTYAVINATSTSQSVVVRATTTSGTSTGVTLASGEKALIAWNGSDFTKIATSAVDGVSTISFGTTGLTPATATSGAVTVAGTLAVANGGTGVTTSTGTGSVVLSNSPALTTPNLGTPSAATLTNATGLPLSTGVTGTLPVANGGTGQTSYTDGQLLIGNTATTGLTKAALTAGSNITITNGNGSITIASTNSGGTITSINTAGTVNGITLTGGPITSSGTITLGGTLSGVSLTSQVTGTLPVGNGGTGATTLTGVVKGNGTSAFTASNVSLTSEVTGTLPVANGGTGATSLTANNVLLGNGTSAVQVVAPGTAGNVLTSNGTTWTSAAAPASAGAFTATASGSISAGAPVLIDSSGQAVAQINTISTLGNGASSWTGSGTSMSTNNQISVFYSSGIKFAVNTTTGLHRSFYSNSNFLFTTCQTPNSAGTSATASTSQSTAGGSYGIEYDTQLGVSQVVYESTTNRYYFVARPGSSPRNIRINYIQDDNVGNPTVANVTYDQAVVGGGSYTGSPGVNEAKNFEIAVSTNGKVAVVWSDNGNRLFCAVATLSTTSGSEWTWGPMQTIHSSGLTSSQTHMGVAWNANNNEFAVTYAYDVGGLGYPYATLVSVSGTTCTVQATQAIQSSNYTSSDSRHSVCFVTGVNRYVFSFYTDTNVSGAATANSPYLIAASSSGTSLTFGTLVDVYPFGTQSTARRDVAYLYNTPVITNSFVFHFSTADTNTNTSDNVYIYTVSGTTLTNVLATNGFTPIGTTPFSTGPAYAAVGYSALLGTISNIRGTGNSTGTISVDTRYRYTSNQNNNFAGFSSASYTNGQTATVNSVGGTNTQQSSLTPGQRYWLQRAGSLGAVETPNYAGQALSSSTILVKG